MDQTEVLAEEVEVAVETSQPKGRGKAVHSRFARAAGQIFVQTICFQGTTFVANIVLAHSFGLADFGVFSTGMQTLNSASQTAQLATASVGSRYLGVWWDDDRARAIFGWKVCRDIGLKSGAIFTLAIVLLSPIIATKVFVQPNGILSLALAGTGIFFVVASQQLLQGFIAIEKTRIVVLSSIATGALYLVLTIGGKVFGPAASLLGICLSYVFLTAILIVPARSAFSVSSDAPRLEASEVKSLKGQLVSASVSGVLLLSSTWLLLAMVSAQRGAAQAGVYSAATQIRLLLMAIPQITNSLGIVMVNRFANRTNSSQINAYATYALVLVSAGASMLGWVAGPLLPHIFGAKFEGAVSVLRILAGAVFLENCLLAVRQRLQLKAKFNEWLVSVTIPWQAGTFLLAFFLVPRLGANGAAYSYVGGSAIGLLSFGISYFVRKSMNLTARQS